MGDCRTVQPVAGSRRLCSGRRSRVILQFRRAYADTLAEIVAHGVRHGELAEQDPRLVGPGLVGAIGEALTGPLSPLDTAGMTREEVVASITSLCLRAVGAHSDDQAPPSEGERE